MDTHSLKKLKGWRRLTKAERTSLTAMLECHVSVWGWTVILECPVLGWFDILLPVLLLGAVDMLLYFIGFSEQALLVGNLPSIVIFILILCYCINPWECQALDLKIQEVDISNMKLRIYTEEQQESQWLKYEVSTFCGYYRNFINHVIDHKYVGKKATLFLFSNGKYYILGQR